MKEEESKSQNFHPLYNTETKASKKFIRHIRFFSTENLLKFTHEVMEISKNIFYWTMLLAK